MLLPEISTPEGQMRSCQCRISLALTSSGTSLPSAATKAACWGSLQGAWAPSPRDCYHLSYGQFPKSCNDSHLHLLPPLLSHSFIRGFFFNVFYIPRPVSNSKDAEIDQTIGWPHMAISRPEIICGYFLANSFQVLMMGNYSFRSVLNTEPLLGFRHCTRCWKYKDE